MNRRTNRQYPGALGIIDRLPEAKVEELMDYAAYLGSRYSRRQQGVTEESVLLQQEALKKIWDNPEEDIYDENLTRRLNSVYEDKNNPSKIDKKIHRAQLNIIEKEEW